MYKKIDNYQISLFDFNQSFGTPLDAANEWVVYAHEIDWTVMEEQYAALFPSHKGRPARPFRMMLGAMIIQTRLQLSDNALLRSIADDPYLQYFIGMARYEQAAPFGTTALTNFRARLVPELRRKINEQLPEGIRIPLASRIGLVFTTHSDSLVKEVKHCVRKEFGPDTELLIYGDATILDETVSAGHVTTQAASRLIRMYLDAVDAGCQAILNVCSSVGEVADAMQGYAEWIHVPIVRIDEEMCRRAVRADGVQRIAVMATLSSTLAPTRRLLQRCAEAEGLPVELSDLLVDNAFGLDPEPFAERLVEAARQKASDCDGIVLAQASMSLCEDRIRAATGRQVWSSPRPGAQALRQAWERDCACCRS